VDSTASARGDRAIDPVNQQVDQDGSGKAAGEDQRRDEHPERGGHEDGVKMPKPAAPTSHSVALIPADISGNRRATLAAASSAGHPASSHRRTHDLNLLSPNRLPAMSPATTIATTGPLTKPL
jgi:hypothetical protein